MDIRNRFFFCVASPNELTKISIRIIRRMLDRPGSERKYRALDVDIPTPKRSIYSRSSYPSVPLLSLIVSPASEQRPKSLVRSELSTSCIWDAAMSDREIDFSPLSLSLTPSLSRQPRNLFDFNHFRVFSIHFPSVFDARLASTTRYIVLSFPAVFNGLGCVADMRIEKRCIIVRCRIPIPSEVRRSPNELYPPPSLPPSLAFPFCAQRVSSLFFAGYADFVKHDLRCCRIVLDLMKGPY